MAYFAKIENGIVTQVIAVNDDCVPDEETGLSFLEHNGIEGEWVQTGDNLGRGPYASPGFAWDGNMFHSYEEPMNDVEVS